MTARIERNEGGIHVGYFLAFIIFLQLALVGTFAITMRSSLPPSMQQYVPDYAPEAAAAGNWATAAASDWATCARSRAEGAYATAAKTLQPYMPTTARGTVWSADAAGWAATVRANVAGVRSRAEAALSTGAEAFQQRFPVATDTAAAWASTARDRLAAAYSAGVEIVQPRLAGMLELGEMFMKVCFAIPRHLNFLCKAFCWFFAKVL